MILLLALSTAVLAAAGAAMPADSTNEAEMAQLVIERRTYIRITPHQERARTRETLRDWKEKSAPKCLPMTALGGISISRPDSIDLVLRNGQLVRARLEKGCPSIDFYSGFYLEPTRDGRLCEDRDTIHSRTGGACVIDKFRLLMPPKR
ncbi:MAG: hypothetical protein ACKOPR_08705 [Chakrabartia godavariana]